MQFATYHIDTFTPRVFSGNPAIVCLLPEWLEDNKLQAIAKEHYIPVTTFLVQVAEKYHVRWFTPEYELPLCGHGTIAAGMIIFQILQPYWQKTNLQAKQKPIQIIRHEDLVAMVLDTKSIEPLTAATSLQSIFPKQKIFQYEQEHCFVVLDDEQAVQQYSADIAALKQSGFRRISITAKAKQKADFVYRTFYPNKMISEDAVNGSSLAALVPYWFEQLNKKALHAISLSARGGEAFCRYDQAHVSISGKAVIYAQGIVDLKKITTT